MIKKENRKLKTLADEQKELEKKIQKMQSDLEYNKKVQERQVLKIEKAKSTLSELIAKNPKGA